MLNAKWPNASAIAFRLNKFFGLNQMKIIIFFKSIFQQKKKI